LTENLNPQAPDGPAAAARRRVFNAVLVEPPSGVRRLDPRESRPYSLAPVGDSQEPVLDWVINSLARTEARRVTYVGGYHIEKVIDKHPNLNVVYQHDRLTQGEVASMLMGAGETEGLLVLRADAVFLTAALERLLAHPHPCFGTVAGSGGHLDCQAFCVMRDAVPDFLDRANAVVRENPKASFNDLGRVLADNGFAPVDLTGHAAPITDRGAISRIVFKGKVQTLDNLAGVTRTATVLPRFSFTLADWTADRMSIVDRIAGTFSDDMVIVRSSAAAEDTAHASAAGAFESVLDVQPSDRAATEAAIERVVGSYARDGRAVLPVDEVLVQPQIRDLVSSGVLLTRDPGTGAPYYVIDTDEESGRSDIVTSGAGGKTRTFYVKPGSATDHLPETVRRIVAVGDELVSLTQNASLDLEFGIGADGVFYLFQARPLAGAGRLPVAEEDFDDMLASAKEFVGGLCRPRAGIAGTRSVLGMMTDWNPAEMIGDAPKALALSLYQSLIGNESWAAARAAIGYRDMRPHPLIVSVAGKPFVDVRNSLNSLLPQGIDESIAEKLVNKGVETLAADPRLHDKIEFDVAVTCLTPGWPEDRERLAAAGLNDKEIAAFEESLRRVTQDILNGQSASAETLNSQLDRLEERRRTVMALDAECVTDHGHRLRCLIDDCRRFGIMPFAIFARFGFIALALLRGLAARDVLSADDIDEVHRAVPTIAGQVSDDIAAFQSGTLAIDTLIARYGHLRPHSYDITSPNYAADPERYFAHPPHGTAQPVRARPARQCKSVLETKRASIEQALNDIGLKVPFDAFTDFIISAIAGREAAKFHFMRSLNDALEEIAMIGAHFGISRDRLAHVPVDEFLVLSSDSTEDAFAGHLRRLADYREKRWLLTQCVHIPELIRSPGEVLAFEVMRDRPNFVTRERIAAPAVWLDDHHSPVDLTGKIVVISSADPGYDWIFGYDIAGLVTKYGGAGSHMSIRAAEFGLPAAIGCGEVIYESLRAAPGIEIDCAQGTLSPA
jgi:hypothetical protein